MDQTQNDRTYRPLSGTVYETIDQEDIGNDASLRGPVYMAEEDDLNDIANMNISSTGLEYPMGEDPPTISCECMTQYADDDLYCNNETEHDSAMIQDSSECLRDSRKRRLSGPHETGTKRQNLAGDGSQEDDDHLTAEPSPEDSEGAGMDGGVSVTQPAPDERPRLPDGIKPPIWAESRQALCETFDRFRAYQSGIYHRDGKAVGYLLSYNSSKSDRFLHRGKLIISHGGGKQRVNDSRGYPAGRALLESFRRKEPVVLLVDDRYKGFPYRFEEKVAYAVLGYYWIRDAWAERIDDRIEERFAFQWCDAQGTPWWSMADVNVDNQTGEQLDPHGIKQFCETCQQSSPIVFQLGWTCLNQACQNFWDISGSPLQYDESFLLLRPNPDFHGFPWDLRPKIMRDKNGEVANRQSTHGWCCDGCNRLCSREMWECWHCEGCGKTYNVCVQSKILSHKDFWYQEKSLRFAHYEARSGSGITCRKGNWSENSVRGFFMTFQLPGDRGKIHLISGNPLANACANELFTEYQEVAAKGGFFRRYPLQMHRLRGKLLVNYFSHNSGVPYKYVGETNATMPFDQSPPVVSKAKLLIEERVKNALGLVIEFNEVLSVAYVEEQGMSYHTDDEKGLGPIVSSLSLGSIAFMHFRRRVKTHESPDNNRTRDLTLVLKHGDVMVMEGAGVQKYYEHSAEPKNFRIVATARLINPTNAS